MESDLYLAGITHDLRCAQGDLLVVLLILGLDRHRVNAMVQLGDVSLELLDCWASALSLHLAGLVFLAELLFHLFDDFQALVQLRNLHLLLAVGNPLLIVFLELLLDLLGLLLDQEGLVFLDPFHVKILVSFEECSALLLLEVGLEIKHLHLQPPLLVPKTLDLLEVNPVSTVKTRAFSRTHPFAHLLHRMGMTRRDCPFMITQDGNPAVRIIIGLNLFWDGARRLHLLEQVAHGEGGVVGTENLGGQTRHVVLQMLVEGRGLSMSVKNVNDPNRGLPLTVSRSNTSSPFFLGAFLKIFKFLKT